MSGLPQVCSTKRLQDARFHSSVANAIDQLEKNFCGYVQVTCPASLLSDKTGNCAWKASEYLRNLKIDATDQVYGVVSSSRLLPIVRDSVGNASIPFISLGHGGRPLSIGALTYDQAFAGNAKPEIYRLMSKIMQKWPPMVKVKIMKNEIIRHGIIAMHNDRIRTPKERLRTSLICSIPPRSANAAPTFHNPWLREYSMDALDEDLCFELVTEVLLLDANVCRESGLQLIIFRICVCTL